MFCSKRGQLKLIFDKFGFVPIVFVFLKFTKFLMWVTTDIDNNAAGKDLVTQSLRRFHCNSSHRKARPTYFFNGSLLKFEIYAPAPIVSFYWIFWRNNSKFQQAYTFWGRKIATTRTPIKNTDSGSSLVKIRIQDQVWIQDQKKY